MYKYIYMYIYIYIYIYIYKDAYELGDSGIDDFGYHVEV
jgi:hypothetical protein